MSRVEKELVVRKPLTPLARHRMARGLKQMDLAKLMQVDQSAISAWESGRYRPEPSRIAALANHLNVTPLRCAELLDAAPTLGGAQ